MYCIINSSKLVQAISTFQTVRRWDNKSDFFKDVNEIRHKTGLGLYICKLLAQKAQNNEDSINLLNKLIKELND